MKFFISSPQHKNANIANFVLDVSFEIQPINVILMYSLTSNFMFTNIIWKETANMGMQIRNNATIAKFYSPISVNGNDWQISFENEHIH